MPGAADILGSLTTRAMPRPLTHQRFEPFQRADLELDVAIVGGGMAGVYSAWRLASEARDAKTTLFE